MMEGFIKGNMPRLMMIKGCAIGNAEGNMTEHDDVIHCDGSKITFSGDNDSIAHEEFKQLYERLKLRKDEF